MSNTTNRSPDAGFSRVLEKAVRDVLKDESASPIDKLKAIEAGTKLLAIKFKMTGVDTDADYFK